MPTFTINGLSYSAEEGAQLSLAQYIREVALLTGTKVSCGEGGCGACIVTVRKTKGGRARSLNSCLAPVNICDGWEVTTVEGLGGKAQGYHPIQESLAANGGTQCGYCSPGMVMQLHSYLQEHPEATKQEIDNILDGNICRCTGYRPILDAFKQFASDSKDSFDHLIGDIEDLKLCERTGKVCEGRCHGTRAAVWHHPTSLSDLQQVLASFTTQTRYRIVGGNTGTGVFKRDEEAYDAFININKIPELKEESSSPMYLGGNVTITDAIHFFSRAGQSDPRWSAIARHLGLIASQGIRNQGTLAGNLMMKNAHNDFPSDVFISMETVGATLEIITSTGAVEEMSVVDFVTHDMNRKFIKRITFPTAKQARQRDTPQRMRVGRMWYSPGPTVSPRAGKTFIRTFKIMPRSSNAHAYVNAGFLANINVENNFQVVGKPTVIFGGISSTFCHAKQTEAFLEGKNMNDHAMFLEAVSLLESELEPSPDPVLAAPEYRRQLALGLFYKFFLHVLGSSASPEVQSGAEDLDRGLSSGQQSFDTDEDLWPVSEPREKVEAKWQTSGEIQYTGDIPVKQGELHAAFVLTTTANCDIVSVDPSEALAMPGVVEFVTADDVPGENNWKPAGVNEEIFSSGRSNYAGQSVGLILAQTRDTALEAARKVKLEYGNKQPVVTDMEAAMETPANIVSGGYTMEYGDVTGALASADHVVEGRFKMGSQYHFHMETQTCIVTPMEDGFDLEIASQDVNNTQHTVAAALATSANSINVTVKRLGGAYGAKITLPIHLATAGAVAANKVNKPVRIWMPLEDNMKMLGMRNHYLFDYKIGLSAEGKVLGVESSIYADSGWSLNEVDSMMAAMFGQSCYKIPACKYIPYGVRTDTCPPTATRAPGMINGAAMIEAVLEHAAAEMGVNSLDLRLNNMMEQGDITLPPPLTLQTPNPIPQMIADLQNSADFTARQTAVETFNAANKWKKRGLSLVPFRYGHNFGLWGGVKFHCLISVFGGDGSVSVAYSGVEMGQGINTKVVQCIAYELGISVDMIKIKPVTAVTNPNAMTTGGSAGSECNCVAAIEACKILKARLEPIRNEVGQDATWPELISAANTAEVDLCARYMFEAKKDDYPGYNVWGAGISEVEVDILTGEMYVVRTDILEDAGLSTSPIVDIGQVEGAFIMGLGLFTSEEIKHDLETGELLTKNTWEYKPPAAKDIPQDFRVSLLKNARNPLATGEPGMLMSISVLFAIRSALESARKEAGLTGWWQFNAPATVEKIQQHGAVKQEHFVF